VTGYLVSTLLNYGEVDLSKKLARWLVSIQRQDGSYASPKGRPHIFDTAQALRGLLASVDIVPRSSDACKRAAAYLYLGLVDDGKKGFTIDRPWMSHYSKDAPVSIHLYALPPLVQASELFEKPEYQTAAENCLNYYLGSKEAFQTGTLTHFLGYELEAVIDLGERSTASKLLDRLAKQQSTDGSIRAMDTVSWVCTPGLAQLAICWYKLGNQDPANKAMKWLDEHQMPSGGFLGSYGPKATYFPNAEISWAAKFYLDASLLRSDAVVET
jgi:malonyl-CoA O-methyltransferase